MRDYQMPDVSGIEFERLDLVENIGAQVKLQVVIHLGQVAAPNLPAAPLPRGFTQRAGAIQRRDPLRGGGAKAG
jgi:hypothetical protein